MKRVPETELMENCHQITAYSTADFSSSDEVLIKRLETLVNKSGLKIQNDDQILDIGCGPGNIAFLLAQKWPSTKIIGIDGSQGMINAAEEKLAKIKDSETVNFANIKFLCVDINNISELINKLEKPTKMIISNSLLHHIHDPRVFWNAVKALSMKGTINFHTDLIRPRSEVEAKQIQLKHLAKAPPILIKDYLASLKAAFTLSEVKLQLKRHQLESFIVEKREDRYLQIFGIC